MEMITEHMDALENTIFELISGGAGKFEQMRERNKKKKMLKAQKKKDSQAPKKKIPKKKPVPK